MALTDEILASLQSGPMDQIAQQLDLQPDQVEAVIKDALPALLGGMEHNVESEGGAASLANALGDHADANPLGDIGALIGGGIGGKILEHVLGGSSPQVSDAISGTAGVSGVDVQKIMKIAAPIVMAYLAKQVFNGGGNDAAVVKEKVKKESAAAKQSSSTPDLGSILGAILGNR